MKMVKRLIFLTYVSLCIGGLTAVIYDCFSGKPVNRTQLRIYAQRNNTGVCTVEVKPCDPEEWKRLDGSCNNLKYPSRGAHRTPTVRLLPYFDFSPNYEPRKAADGGDLELARRLRTEILCSGKASDLKVTQLVLYYMSFSIGDVINSFEDVCNKLCYENNKLLHASRQKRLQVYTGQGARGRSLHRFSGISCMNLTRPQSFQTYGCLDNGTEYARMVFPTPVYDLSNTYNLLPGFIDQLRSFKNGLLKIERDNGLFPPTDPDSTACFLNQRPKETRCNKYQENNAVGPNIINILFYRQHNKIAEALYKLNPCWNDERLFFTARDINIAISLQILFYELLPILLGRSNLIRDGIISCNGGYRDLYDENIQPQMSDEYVYGHRWFHTAQETTLKFYDVDGCYLRSMPMVNFTARTGFLAEGNNMAQIIQGSFRQPGGSFDYTVDPDMSNRVLGGALLSSDMGASDLHKGRLFGFPPYIKYKEFCTKRSYKSFSDLEDSFSPERLYRLMQHHKCPSDMDLMGAMWAENRVKGGRVPETLYCLMVEKLRRTIASDRHWYERPNRPHAFTEEQLKAIRKVTIVGMLCWVGDHVTEIQPSAFNTISSKNPLMKCSSCKIGKLDLSAWKDSGSCNL